MFHEFASRLTESSPEHDWSHIDDAVAFSALRKFSTRCRDVLELLQTGEDFSRLKSVNIVTDRGRMLTGMVHAIHDEFQQAYRRFQPGNRTYSILRPEDARFDKHYLKFRRSLRDWDVRLAAVFEQGFDDCIAINPNGGAIALGHPLGMTGARIVGTTCLEINIRKAQSGLVSMCVGVGQGVALSLALPT